VYSSSQGCHTATETHMRYGITQCYLPPGRGDTPALVWLSDSIGLFMPVTGEYINRENNRFYSACILCSRICVTVRVRPSVCPIRPRSSVRRVCCCGSRGQAISIDCCTAHLQQHGGPQQMISPFLASGASTPYKRWSKCTMKKIGGKVFAGT